MRLSDQNTTDKAPVARFAVRAIAALSATASLLLGGSNSAQAQVEMIFQADKAIEVAFFTVRTGFEAQLFEEYFPQVAPLVIEAGGLPMGAVPISNTAQGNINAATLAFFEWPTIERYRAFLDQPVLIDELFPFRDETISYINPNNFYTVPETVKITFDPTKTYVASAVWYDDQRSGDWEAFESATSELANDAGAVELLELTRDDGSFGPYTADTFWITEWPSTEAYTAHIASEAYAEQMPQRNQGAYRYDAFVIDFGG